MYIRNPLPSTIKEMNRLLRLREEGKTLIQIEQEYGIYYTTVSAYVSWLRKHPEFIEKEEKEGGENK